MKGIANSVLASVDWPTVTNVVGTQQKARQHYSPVISIFRWWARRPNALVGAILDASSKVFCVTDLCISDPFSGGGTVAFESAARQLSVYAQDLYPWPTFCLATGLSESAIEEMEAASIELLEDLDQLRLPFYRSDGRELSHILRVRRGECPSCAGPLFLFPNPMFSVASRRVNEKEAFYGCQVCGNVQRDSKDLEVFSCKECGALEPNRGRGGLIVCPHCSSADLKSSYYCEKFDWKPVLVQEAQEVDGKLRGFLREVERGDPVDFVNASIALPELRVPIQDGVETRRLHLAGFHLWGDLYTTRQAQVICRALEKIMDLDISEGCRDRLALAVIGMAEMPAFLSRWDRFHAKAYEGMANHRYAHTTITVETNLLAMLGRGTLRRRLKSALRALVWKTENIRHNNVPVCLVKREKRGGKRRGVRIATGDSRIQGLRSSSVDVVLTDPPYFDDVQYGELARLFHFWLSRYREIGEIEESREAVPNQQRGNGKAFYEKAVGDCLKESHRTLKNYGRLILTFHNRSLCAWESLARALAAAGFVVEALVVVRAENGADLTKRNGKGLLYDLVLECVKRESTSALEATVVYAGESEEEKNILAVGVALDYVVRNAEQGLLAYRYRKELSKLGVERSLIKCGRKCSESILKAQEPLGTVS